jgi:hypothetical protein
MSVTANLTTNVETITATIVVEDETIIVQVSAAARGPAGEAGAAGAAGPNTLTTATTTNLDGFISGDGTNISGATAAATTATANTLVLRSAGGGASFAGLNTNSGSYAQIGGENFNVATTTNANLTTTGSGTVIVSGAGGTTISGGTLTFSPSGFAYGAGAAAAHRTALGLGISQNVTFGSVSATYDNGDKVRIEALAYIIGSGARISFRSGPWYTAEDASIVREGTGILSQRSDLNPQESRIYGTYTDTSNYRRLALKMSTAGVAQIVAEGLGTGAAGNRIEIDGLRIGKGGSNIATNTALGASALNANTTGGTNTAVGFAALESNTTGSSNSAVGFASLFSNTTGGSNSAVGVSAGRYIANGATLNTVTNNSVYLGASTKALASNQTNQIVIGYNAIGLGSNTAVLGNDNIETTALKGNVGIGTTSPQGKLHVAVPAGTPAAVFSDTGSPNSIPSVEWRRGPGSAPSLKLDFPGNVVARWTVGDAVTRYEFTGAPIGVSTNSSFQFGGVTGSTATAIIGHSHTDNNNGALLLSTRGSGVTAERVRITNTGNVGIGTTSPTSKLTVTGGDVEVTDSASGIILKSPDGTRYRVTVSDLGVLSTASLP